jgi:hypothetical protein
MCIIENTHMNYQQMAILGIFSFACGWYHCCSGALIKGGRLSCISFLTFLLVKNTFIELFFFIHWVFNKVYSGKQFH